MSASHPQDRVGADPADARALGLAEGQFRATALALIDPGRPGIWPVGHVQRHRLDAGDTALPSPWELLLASSMTSSADQAASGAV
jgi:hypothetical protein